PAVLVHRAVSQNLEILLRVSGGCFGIIEGESKTYAVHRHLWDAIDLIWRRQVRRFKDSRCDIGAMSELTAHPSLIRDAFWPTNYHRVTNTPKMRCDLFAPLKRRVVSPCTSRRVIRRHVGASPFSKASIGLDRVQLLIRCKRDAVERGHFVEGSCLRAFHARAVVAEDAKDQCVVSQ